MIVKWFIILAFFFFQSETQAQNIVVLSQSGGEIETELPIYIALNFDNDTTIVMVLDNGSFHLDSNLCSVFVDIEIDPIFGQPYHNQYLRSQLASIDTIVVNQTRMIKSQTPRLLFREDKNMDSIFVEQLWIGNWLQENKETTNGISFWIYNADTLKNSDRKFTEKLIHEYCKRVNLEEFANEIVFKDEPYTTGQDDHFNDGTLIDRIFIEDQNTPFMKTIAEKYTLVVVVIIDWNQ